MCNKIHFCLHRGNSAALNSLRKKQNVVNREVKEGSDRCHWLSDLVLGSGPCFKAVDSPLVQMSRELGVPRQIVAPAASRSCS